MPCENYREALIEAAAAHSEPSRELRSHLDACASCRAIFTEEVQLFAAIDTGLRAIANVEVPASLLPGVRVQLNGRPVARRSWVPASAALAAAAALVVVLVCFHDFGRDAAKLNPRVNSVAHNVSPAAVQPIPPTPAPYERGVLPGKNKTLRPVGTQAALEVEEVAVLIPPGQKQAIDALLVSVQKGKVEADVLLAEKPTGTLEELQVSRLDISPIEVRPLADVSGESTPLNEGTRR
jgi:anti-sigma-K factor RskA